MTALMLTIALALGAPTDPEEPLVAPDTVEIAAPCESCEDPDDLGRSAAPDELPAGEQELAPSPLDSDA